MSQNSSPLLKNENLVQYELEETNKIMEVESSASNASPKGRPMSSAPKSQKITPPREYENPSLVVDKNIVNELLLVCGVIGSTVDPETQQIVPVEDCINWLQDLQRALRRDEDAFRPISLLLGQWKVVEQKLLPLVISCRYNTPLILTIVKILVILTKPISENAKKAANAIIDIRKGKTDPMVVKEQIKLRENAIAQANLLAEYKKSFVHHTSHLRNKKSKENVKSEGGLLSVFVSLLAEPLSKTGLSRTAEDHLTMELILHLFRNLLCAGDPILKESSKVNEAKILHQELLTLFEKEKVLDFLVVIGQEMENRENKQYNLLYMEILHHMLKNQDPTMVARSVLGKKKEVLKSASKQVARSQTATSSRNGSLLSRLKQERNQMLSKNTSRHSHFAGTLVKKNADGESKFVTAASTTAKSASRSGIASTKAMADEKKKTKKHQHFVGATNINAINSASSINFATSTPTSNRSNRALHSFCMRFMNECYGPVMKTLKNEFRRDSSRLESDDKVIFFRLVWFFSQWWRIALKESGLSNIDTSAAKKETKSNTEKSLGNLIFTMDVFTFNLVLTSADFFMEHKKYRDLAQTVSLYVEMMHLLSNMYQSTDSTEQIMAMGLMDRLFYQSEPIDRLGKLLNAWIPGTFTRDYVCDLLELTNVTLKLLDANAKACDSFKDLSGKKKSKKKSQHEDAVHRMRAEAADFDVLTFFGRKIVSNQVVFMFGQLLSQYNINATHINDHIVSLFVRFCKFVVARDEDYDEWEGQKKTKITLEPMLFNLPLLTVLNEILNDTSLQGNELFDNLLKFASTIVRHFARASEENPMLFVEAMIRHPIPHRYCETVANIYVTDELLMIAERDMLLEQSNLDDDDSDEEDAPVARPTRKVANRTTSPKAQQDEDDDEEEELEFIDDVQAKPVEKDSDSSDDESTKSSNEKTPKTKEDDIQAIEKELDEEEERWNDRRSFKPKRKLLSQPGDSEEAARDTSEIDDEANEADEEVFAAPLPQGKRIKKSTVLEDSDDEDFGKPTSTLVPSRTATKMLLEDSDEE